MCRGSQFPGKDLVIGNHQFFSSVIPSGPHIYRRVPVPLPYAVMSHTIHFLQRIVFFSSTTINRICPNILTLRSNSSSCFSVWILMFRSGRTSSLSFNVNCFIGFSSKIILKEQFVLLSCLSHFPGELQFFRCSSSYLPFFSRNSLALGIVFAASITIRRQFQILLSTLFPRIRSIVLPYHGCVPREYPFCHS